MTSTRETPSLARARANTRTLGQTLLLTMFASVGLSGHQLPNLSGNWNSGLLRNPTTYTGRANRSDSELQVGLGVTRLVIRQDAKTLKIVEENVSTEDNGPNTLIYELDGTPTKNPFRLSLGKTRVDSLNRSLAVEERILGEYTTKWKGGQLVSAITIDVPGEKDPRHYEETISLGTDGILSIRIHRIGTGDSRTLSYKKE